MADRSTVLDALIRTEQIAPDWAPSLRAVDPAIDAKVEAALAKVESAGSVLPREEYRWRAYQTPLSEVRVLILGQDPYPNPDHAVGLSFSTGPGGPIPGSLRNIHEELRGSNDAIPEDGDLSAWARQGVMLLNRALTLPLEADARPRRHLGWWRPLTIATMGAIAREAADRPIAALLWGAPAHKMSRYLEPNVKIFASSHPSGMSVTRPAGEAPPFRGSAPFSAVNEWLVRQGTGPIDWSLRGATSGP